MYKPYDPDKVFRTTPKKSLEDILCDTAYSFLSNGIHYGIPVVAGLAIGNGLISQDKSVVVGAVTSVCSAYIQSLNYKNDFVNTVGDSTLVEGLKNELRFREALGVLRGAVEGGVLLVASGYAAAYFQRACDLVK